MESEGVKREHSPGSFPRWPKQLLLGLARAGSLKLVGDRTAVVWAIPAVSHGPVNRKLEAGLSVGMQVPCRGMHCPICWARPSTPANQFSASKT